MLSVPYPIIDAHIHLFVTTPLTHPEKYRDLYTPMEIKMMKKRFDKNLKERGQPPIDTSCCTAKENADRWHAQFEKCGITRGAFISMENDYENLRDFLSLGRERFLGYAFLDPLREDGPAYLERSVKEYGLRGLKLIATNQKFHPYDARIYPLWEKAQELQIPVLIHMGASIGYSADFRFANPLDLQPVLRDFPDLVFMLAHFGVGFFREALLLGYQCDNVYYDTSSSNIWMKYQGFPITLKDVFRYALDAVGPGRIVFGTDSSYFPRGYRFDVLKEQHEALEALGVSEEDRAKIFGGNIARLMKL
ncbi:MAG: amidohydrolase family protein [Candidatus Eremiobacteraeota bacterium]|nr:amidohydrolase family protein [Candidatus Eremiobacteraeota bacterium]